MSPKRFMVSKRKPVIVILLLGALLFLFPFKTTLVPEQRVLVVTQDMHPVKDAMVRQSWKHYSLERYGHEQDLSTDAHGRVTFPVRNIRASLLWRALGPVGSIVGQGVHASFGVQTDIFPLSPSGTPVSSEVAQPQPGEIVFR
jgi:hypothetical protein